ncbi:hypothetical protein B0H17DRAFT_1202505 [Mycena rosella]|uniref:Uncharacterized protein n=1 Tax=Mycena rosella TaxID=1033263 RepID=A0AAD7DDP3_MYCRO|nr:hypothetical protein B0H17DRAFT_1202505 [Mycena rosella]
MANPPKVAALKLTPRAMSKKMDGVRAAKKVMVKKAGGRAKKKKVAGEQQEREGESEGEGGAERGARGKASMQRKGKGKTKTVEEGVETGASGTATAGVEATAPAFIFTSTNNNSDRLKAERARERAENKRLFNPDGPSQLYITKPRREVRPAQNKGAVISMVDKRLERERANQALNEKARKEDEVMLKALKGTKRKAEENVEPASNKRGKIK